MTLEDEATDIVHKAARGLGVRVPPHGSADELRAAARTLGLDPDALLAVADGSYRPGVQCPPHLKVVTTTYGNMEVNAYRIGAACFDTGADASALLTPGKPDALFVTHQHPDHIADLEAFEGVAAHVPDGRPLTGTFAVGDLTIEARGTPGHSVDGTTYVVTSPRFPAPIAIVGDALFAGSMGGPQISYPQCLEGARTQILSLPDDTVLCPGHGPLTTVASEKANNPFFA